MFNTIINSSLLGMKRKAAAPLLLLLPQCGRSSEVFCHLTYQECTNGLFNPEKCACECIPPYCPDTTGDCLIPGGVCGGNPWESCTPEVNCPWWTIEELTWADRPENENCYTGGTVPPGIFTIYPSRDYCCKANFPYSTVCNPVTTSPSVSPSTSTPTKSPVLLIYETIPLRLSLFGLPKDVLDIPGSTDAIMDELKRLVTNVSNEIDGFKITHEYGTYEVGRSSTSRILFDNDRFSPGRTRTLQTKVEDFSSIPTQTINLSLDVTVTKNSEQTYAPILIKAVRSRHEEILHQLQEFSDQGGYPHASNFDLCTTSPPNADPKKEYPFDLCTLEHQSVRIKFSASGLPHDLDQIILLEDELSGVYSEILNKINGLDLVDIKLDERVEVGNSTDIYFDVDCIRDDQNNWTESIDSRLHEEVSTNRLLNMLDSYSSDISSLDENGQTTKWCVDDRDTFEPCVVEDEPYVMPMWLIITIASASGVILCCILISILVSCQNAREDDIMKDNLQTFVVDPQMWREKQIEGFHKEHRSVGRRKDSRHHGDKRRSRHRHDSHRRQRRSPPRLEMSPMHPRLMPPPTQRLRQIEGPIYCDDEEVNRPPRDSGNMLMLTNG